MKSLLVAFCLVGAGSCTIALTDQRLLHPSPAGALTQEDVTRAAPVFTITQHDIVASDGIHLRAVRLRQPGAQTTILYYGGRKYRTGVSGAKTASRFATLGQDLFIADYRGYGQSEGIPTQDDIASDVLTVFDYVAALPDVGASRVVVHGHSMGSFAAGYVAAHRQTGGVVLESSATTAEDWVKARIPTLAKPFVKVEIADDLKGKGNLVNMSLITQPLLILVGANDRTTPASLSKALYAASTLSPELKSLVIVQRADHSSVMAHKQAIEAYRRFLTEVEGMKVAGR